MLPSRPDCTRGRVEVSLLSRLEKALTVISEGREHGPPSQLFLAPHSNERQKILQNSTFVIVQVSLYLVFVLILRLILINEIGLALRLFRRVLI